MKVRGFGLTDVGRVREVNEDALLMDDRLGVYAVSDGMGGHAAGEEASRLAIEAVRDAVKGAHKRVDPSRGDVEHGVLREVAVSAVASACARVYDEATSVPELSGMGCTLTVLLLAGARGVMAHVGDSRLYLCRDATAWQLSSDHTMAADLVRRGEMTASEAVGHPYSNALTRVLGAQRSTKPETLVLDVLPDDVFLLCSDGLSNYVDGPGELSTSLSRADLEDVPRDLVARANERGGRDNITALVVQAVAADDEQSETLPRDVRAALHALREVPAFKSVRFADLLRILRSSEIRTCKRNEVVVAKGSDLNALYLPLDGELEVRAPDGRTVRVRRGDVIGLTSLLVRRPCEAPIRAQSTSKLLRLGGDAFRELAARRPRLGVAVLSSIAGTLGDELERGGLPVTTSPKRARPWWNPFASNER